MDATGTALWEALKPLWPSNAEVNETPHRHLVVTYLTLDDDLRPGRRSREVELQISEPVLHRLDAATADGRHTMAHAIAARLKGLLKQEDLRADLSEPIVYVIDEGWIY